ncbi:fibrobacter succinogenes major paralogous domain-containing protein [uncultured Fibrobacter sp.]|uniref:fibrobacter succinogenes major paralogous domain-containing protein n=1 Tax=uncultured Fibrobacter sp. TaxID=261512 RepID=UPI0025E13939|nr:fibrobacter succinogenes major paralogous domain-containing protein [uncultured Fibrobacter sp.]
MKKFLISVILTALLAACTDYVQQIDDRDGEWNRFVLSRMTDLRDGKTYKTVTIGNQTWMAENLNYEVNYKSNSFCYKDSTKYCAKYGHLYTWDAAMKACPDGWHLPSEDEFNTLFAAVGGQSVAAKMLKSSSGWQDGNGLDNYAFSALPVGRRYPDDGRYYLNGYAAYFWSSTENSSYGANYIYMDDNSDNPEIDNSDLSLAYSVRCLKDEGTTPQSSSSTKISSSSDTPESSSSEAKSSSSSVTPQSSSSEKAESSSSKVTEPAEVTTGTMTDSRDGQTYKTVTIGTQTWMAENLNYEIFGSYCYDYDDSNCAKYGRLYTWATALESCPVGWHLPTKAEFETLFTAVGGKSLAGEKLKSRDGWDSDGYGTDTYGFTALPAGYWNYAGGSYQKDREAYFWSSTENSSEYAYYMDLFCNNKNAMMSYLYKKYGYSVRCLKDAQAE